MPGNGQTEAAGMREWELGESGVIGTNVASIRLGGNGVLRKDEPAMEK